MFLNEPKVILSHTVKSFNSIDIVSLNDAFFQIT